MELTVISHVSLPCVCGGEIGRRWGRALRVLDGLLRSSNSHPFLRSNVPSSLQRRQHRDQAASYMAGRGGAPRLPNLIPGLLPKARLEEEAEWQRQVESRKHEHEAARLSAATDAISRKWAEERESRNRQLQDLMYPPGRAAGGLMHGILPDDVRHAAATWTPAKGSHAEDVRNQSQAALGASRAGM